MVGNVIPSSLVEMASSWRIYDSFATEDGRFRVSLQTPVEEPWSDYLDLRRMFQKNGEFLCTRRGIRINTSAAHLTELAEALQTIVRGEERCREAAGLHLIRRFGMLQVRRVVRSSEGGPPPIIVLSPSEVVFLLAKLLELKDIVATREEDDAREQEELEREGGS